MKKRIIFFSVAVAIMVAIILLPQPKVLVTNSGQEIALTAKGKTALAVLVFAVFLWITEAIPFAVTGMMAVSILALAKVAPLKEMCQDGFGNRIIIFVIGVSLFSAAINHTGLLRRLTTWMLFHLGHSPKLIVLSFIVVGGLLSMWLTDLAVAAMFLPIGLAILKDAGAKPLKSNFGRCLMIACCWGPLVGGVATPAGCGPNPLTLGFLRDLVGMDISFLDWMKMGVPASIMMMPFAWLVLIWTFPIEKDLDLTVAEEDLKKFSKEMGPLKVKEIAIMVLFLLTITLWILGPKIAVWTDGLIDYLDIYFVALFCSSLLFLPGLDIIPWKKAQDEIDWGGLILIATGIALGMASYRTGAAEWIAFASFSKIGLIHPIFQIFLVVLGVSLLKVAFSSNTVTGTIMVPLLIALAQSIEMDPLILAIPAGITASLAFILVTSSPTNVVAYSSGYFSIRDMAKAGLFMTVFSSVCVTISIVVFGRFFGLVAW